jgi:hypothetical protein
MSWKPAPMTERNLYAPPQAEVAEVRKSHCSRDGKVVVVPAGSDLPARCIVYEPASLPIKKRKVYWHSPWLYLLILINLLLYLIVGLIARKSYEVSAGLCEAHAARRKRRLLTFVLLAIGSSVVATVLLSQNQPELATLLFVLAAVFLIVAAIASRLIHARKITTEYARVGGCKEPFLASLE